MKRARYLLMMGFCMLLTLGLAATALGATISGTVTNESGQTGRIFLSVIWDWGAPSHWGVSIPAAGDYEIRGVRDGSYRVFGYVDENDDGIPNISEGSGLSEPFTISGGTVVAGSPALTIVPRDPAEVVPAAVYSLKAIPLDGGVLLMWAAPDIYDIFIQADSFRIEWSTDDFANVLDSLTVPAGNGRNNGILFVPALTNGNLYWFRVISIVGSAESAPVKKSARPRAPLGGYTISGTVNLDDVTDAAGHPLMIVAEGVGGQNVSFQAIPSITNGAAFSIPDVDPDYYHLYAYVDMNGDNQPSTGDYWTTTNPQVTVTGASVGGQTLAIAKPAAIAALEIEHIFYAGGESYGMTGYVKSGAERPVNVYMNGPGLVEGVDLAWANNKASYWQKSDIRPLLDDEYSFIVEYSDGTGGALTASPTAVYDSPVPGNVAPTGTVTSMPANITWAGNEALPQGWVVDVDIWGVDVDFGWETNTLIAPDATSLPYDGPALSAGSYYVKVEFCEDWNWNCVTWIEMFNVEGDNDADGILNADDNCPDVANASQSNVDGNAFGDACDTGDFDGDGVADYLDSQPAVHQTPLDDYTVFVRQVYLDFLNREPDSGGLSYWVGELNAGRLTRTALVEQYLLSPEFGEKVSPVTRLYFAYFNRLPDYSGLMYWVNEYASGNRTLNNISDFFAASTEFQTTYGSLDNGQFVDMIYENLFSRTADQGGKAYWTSELDSGRRTRGQVMADFSESQEYKDLMASPIYVTMTYIGLLRRTPEQDGYNYWVSQMDQGAPGQGLINGFLVSAEYAARF